jgi:hypothetical protein
MLRRGFAHVVLLGAVCIGSSALAGDLKTPPALENTATLPAGVRNPRFVNVFTWIGSRFADDGHLEPLGNTLNKVVTWRDVIDAQEDKEKQLNLRALLRSSKENLNEDGSPGSTTGEVNTFADVKVAAIAFGVTDKLTIAGVLPIVKIDVSASTGFIAGNEGRVFLNEAGEKSSPLTSNEAGIKLNDAITQKLVRLGYETIPSFQTISGVGDAQVVAKYRLHDDGVNALAVRSNLIFPTGIAPNADKALDIPTGDGRFGVGAGAIYDRRLPLDLRWNSYGNYTALMPRRITRRLPTSVRDTLSADKDSVYENIRSQFAFGTGVDHLFSRAGLILGGGYAFQYQTRTSYQEGTAFEAGRYHLLEDLQPMQAMHSMLVTAGFSTVEWFRQKKFALPLQLNMAYTHPLSGRNVAASDLVVGEVVLFF